MGGQVGKRGSRLSEMNEGRRSEGRVSMWK